MTSPDQGPVLAHGGAGGMCSRGASERARAAGTRSGDAAGSEDTNAAEGFAVAGTRPCRGSVPQGPLCELIRNKENSIIFSVILTSNGHICQERDSDSAQFLTIFCAKNRQFEKREMASIDSVISVESKQVHSVKMLISQLARTHDKAQYIPKNASMYWHVLSDCELLRLGLLASIALISPWDQDPGSKHLIKPDQGVSSFGRSISCIFI